jgi:hypothetical protein
MGVLSRLILVFPRILMFAALPTVPLAEVMSTPVALPWISVAMLVGALSSVCLEASMVLTALPISRLRCSPVAVTTISLSETAALESAKSAVAVWPSATCTWRVVDA